MTPEQLKASILQYAIQGKLVEQRPEEGTGEELYQQIQAEKQRLIKEKKIKKEKTLAEITEGEIPFDIPDSWKWVKLGDCTGYAQTKEKVSPKDITGDMWSLDLEDIQKDTGAILVKTKASERKISGDKVKFHKGQVLYSKLRPYLKKILVRLIRVALSYVETQREELKSKLIAEYNEATAKPELHTVACENIPLTNSW